MATIIFLAGLSCGVLLTRAYFQFVRDERDERERDRNREMHLLDQERMRNEVRRCLDLN